jgi:hypothetical protein
MRAGTHRSTHKPSSGSYDKAPKEEVVGIIEERGLGVSWSVTVA